jgi:prepilin-type N-terminal cleavage/methylation domain-containing protein
MSKKISQSGFTLIEIAIVLLIVAILLGYTVALFPRQQELKQYRAVEQEMDEIIDVIVGFAQVNGRLPCPAIPDSLGAEDGGGVGDCTSFAGFVPANTIGFEGKLNGDTLLLDPWGNPYRYYVSNRDNDGSGDTDFVVSGEMRAIGIIDADGDGFIDLDGLFHICDVAHPVDRDVCQANAGNYFSVFGDSNVVKNFGPYGGAPFVLISLGKNWTEAAAGDELVNMGDSQSLADLCLPNGTLGVEYLLKDLLGNESTFVKRLSGFTDDLDDVVKWVSPNLLFSKMIEAGQLP